MKENSDSVCLLPTCSGKEKEEDMKNAHMLTQRERRLAVQKHKEGQSQRGKARCQPLLNSEATSRSWEQACSHYFRVPNSSSRILAHALLHLRTHHCKAVLQRRNKNIKAKSAMVCHSRLHIRRKVQGKTHYHVE